MIFLIRTFMMTANYIGVSTKKQTNIFFSCNVLYVSMFLYTIYYILLLPIYMIYDICINYYMLLCLMKGNMSRRPFRLYPLMFVLIARHPPRVPFLLLDIISRGYSRCWPPPSLNIKQKKEKNSNRKTQRSIFFYFSLLHGVCTKISTIWSFTVPFWKWNHWHMLYVSTHSSSYIGIYYIYNVTHI